MAWALHGIVINININKNGRGTFIYGARVGAVGVTQEEDRISVPPLPSSPRKRYRNTKLEERRKCYKHEFRVQQNSMHVGYSEMVSWKE